MTETHETNGRKKLSDVFNKINLYDENGDLSLADQIFSTRAFLILLTISVFAITMFAFINVQTQNITVTSPSEILFNSLSLNYRSTLSCPCTQTLISQKYFISFNPQYHSICRSQLVNRSFISLYLSDEKMSEYWPLDYRIMMASHFQLLALFCQTVQQTITDAINELSDKNIISNKVLFRDVFDAQILSLIQQFKTNIITIFKYTRDFLWINIVRNEIHSGLRTNRMIIFKPNAAIIYLFPLKYKTSNGTCLCETTNNCTHKASIYNYTGRKDVDMYTVYGNLTSDPSLLFTIPGLLVGCFPYNSLLKSTLECFFDQTCIDLFQTFINGSSLISPLSSSYFQSNTTVDDLLNELLIESWNEVSNFTNYYQICAPLTCTYSFNRRFNLLYVILTLISLFGGLKIITYFSAPFIVGVIRQIEKRKCYQKRTIEESIIETASLKERLLQLKNKISREIRTLNLFPSLSDVQNGIYSTRLYLILLITGIIILVFYVSISVRIQTAKINQPTLEQYKQLFAQYSSSIVCPCSRLSIPHSDILNIQTSYHQICSSDFIRDDRWLLYTSGFSGALFSFDFRTNSVRLFSLLQIFCKMAQETVTNELTIFYETQFVSGQISANDTFHSQVSTLIQQFQNQTVATFLQLFQLARRSIQLNQFNLDAGSNSIPSGTVINNITVFRFTSVNSYDNSCSCGTNSCTRPQGFFCRRAECLSNTAPPDQIIPGLVLSCSLTDSLLASSLKCFYNTSCIQMLIEWNSYDYSNITIDPRVVNVTPLNPLLDSRFSIDTTLDSIISQLFIEYWTDSISFKNYFEQCAPIECTYTFEGRFSFAYILSTVLGIIGGLSVTLKIVSPLIIKIFQKIYHRHSVNRRQVFEENLNFFNRLQQINLYNKKQNRQLSENLLIHRQKLATRFYMIIFCLAMIIILIFTSFQIQNYTVTISSPSESEFELLNVQYLSTISCPCSQIAIPYSTFLSVKVLAYHQVCSSYFVSSDFIQLMWGDEAFITYVRQMDRKILSSQFRLLSALCSFAKDTVDLKINTFSSQKLITIETLTHSSFQTQIDSIIKNFISQISTDFRRTLIFITDMLHVNHLQNIFNTNWNTIVSDANSNYIVSTYPISNNETDTICSCATSSTCRRSILGKANTRLTINGIVIGCLPIYGLRFSALRCLYNSTCLARLATFIGTTNVLEPLNNSVQTRFTPIPSILINRLINELFIETWQNSSNYSNYYSACAPMTCQYTYREKYVAVYIITTFLGLYGGLTVGLKVIIWHILNIFWKIHQYIRNCRATVQPITENSL